MYHAYKVTKNVETTDKDGYAAHQFLVTLSSAQDRIGLELDLIDLLEKDLDK